MSAPFKIALFLIVSIRLAFEADGSVSLNTQNAQLRPPRLAAPRLPKAQQKLTMIEEEETDEAPLQLLKEVDMLMTHIVVIESPVLPKEEEAADGNAEERLWGEMVGADYARIFHN